MNIFVIKFVFAQEVFSFSLVIKNRAKNDVSSGNECTIFFQIKKAPRSEGGAVGEIALGEPVFKGEESPRLEEGGGGIAKGGGLFPAGKEHRDRAAAGAGAVDLPAQRVG